ncbi:MAG TPA: hypothetical protein VJ904_04140 [Tichowtungia sp.]|nr:hypothetical protein [Tichowtungia sp.]
MKLNGILLSLLVLVLSGCAALDRSAASVSNGVIANPSLGFFGFSYKIPDGFELYDPGAEEPAEHTALQQMAIRVYNMNEAWHPDGSETFYESFLMFSETAAFLLVTVEHDRSMDTGVSWEEPGLQRPLLPLYNSTGSRRMTLGRNRIEARRANGHAYEKKGWYYARPKRGGMEFSYEACRVSGANRDSYILMGFSLPEHKHILSLQMKEMIAGFQF